MAIVACPNCGAKNRIDESKARRATPVCGKCGAELPPGASESAGDGVVEVTDATFERVVATPGKPVLVDCWAEWCPPCRMLSPVIEQLATESGGRYLVGKLNVDQNPEVAMRFRVESIPTMLIFKDGKLVDKLVGLQPKQAIAAKLNGIA
jgi:thioredoxin 2